MNRPHVIKPLSTAGLFFNLMTHVARSGRLSIITNVGWATTFGWTQALVGSAPPKGSTHYPGVDREKGEGANVRVTALVFLIQTVANADSSRPVKVDQGYSDSDGDSADFHP